MFYVRRERHGKRIRLPDDYGTKQWWEAYYAALAGQALPAPSLAAKTSLALMLEQYQESGEFKSLAEQTRRYRAAQFRTMVSANPNADAAKIQDAHILRGMSERTPDAANNFLKAVRGFFSWAVKLKYLPKDPTEGIAKIAVKSDGYHAVTEAEAEQYRAKHKTGPARLAFDVFVLTGARRGDAARLGPQHVTNGMIEFQAQKTKEWCYVPILPEMQIIIDQAVKEGRVTFIVSESGKPYSVAALGNMMQRWFADAGLEHCSAHGIRKLAATNFANHGVSAHALMAIFGWKKVSQAEVYTKTVDRRALARHAGTMLKPRTTQKG